jgi:flagellar assembly protein FliH
MLARVFKNQESTSFPTFFPPEIGGGHSEPKKINQFIVPDFDEFETVGEIKEIDVESSFSAPNLEDILQQARDEAARIIRQAEENSEIIRQVAHDKGINEAKENFETEIAERISEIRVKLAATIEQISGLSNEITKNVEPEVVELALHIAKKIVGREVTIDREIALTLVKVSLSKLHNRSIAEVHLNPEDFNFVENNREKLDFRGSLKLVEDISISVGGCLIHTETGDIDARIESQFDEISHGLLN